MIAQKLPSTAQTPGRSDWLRLSIGAAVLSAAAVVISQLTALALWPELISFEPLKLPPRSALFTALPALGVTEVFAWLHRRVRRPERVFAMISAAVLLLSIPPDYLLPIAGKTLLASTVTAALHLVAGVVTIATLWYRSTIWKNTGIRVRDGRLLLARTRGLEPVTVELPPALAGLSPAACVEMRLVYDRLGKRYHWHLVVDDGMQPPVAPGDQTLAADLGEIHPAAVANEQDDVVIFSARDLRALNQYRHKRLASLQARQSNCKHGSRLWKRLKRRKQYLLARNERQRRDIEHKVTRAISNHAKAERARRLVVGDVRDVGKGKRLNTNAQQKVSGWSHGRQIAYLTYKLAAEGIALERQSEAYSSKTCCGCGAQNKPKGRTYRCGVCGLVCHRDANGAVNQVSKAVYGSYSRIQPRTIKYRRAFRRSSSDTRHVACRQRQEAAAL